MEEWRRERLLEEMELPCTRGFHFLALGEKRAVCAPSYLPQQILWGSYRSEALRTSYGFPASVVSTNGKIRSLTNAPLSQQQSPPSNQMLATARLHAYVFVQAAQHAKEQCGNEACEELAAWLAEKSVLDLFH